MRVREVRCALVRVGEVEGEHPPAARPVGLGDCRGRLRRESVRVRAAALFE